MTWVAPWTPGLAQADCAACGLTVVGFTLSDDGRCAQCVAVDKQPPVDPAPRLFE